MGVVIIDGSTVRSFVEDETQFNKSIDESFATLDIDKNGTLSRSELRKAFESMRLLETHFGDDVAGPTQAQLNSLYDSIFDNFDLDRSGSVDPGEFRVEMRKIMLAIADGLGESPISMAIDDGLDSNLLKKAADLEASKLQDVFSK
ncbi:hypothetical protein RND81_01G070100 [Saponaria officinalis]|uniref:EF-hand domain-containing protein n=1 Tax=Saponaria officinalis TaxID=3572 RepID=A0AAW1N655_SAPOF